MNHEEKENTNYRKNDKNNAEKMEQRTKEKKSKPKILDGVVTDEKTPDSLWTTTISRGVANDWKEKAAGGPFYKIKHYTHTHGFLRFRFFIDKKMIGISALNDPARRENTRNSLRKYPVPGTVNGLVPQRQVVNSECTTFIGVTETYSLYCAYKYCK
ncbi:unnamed protein product [Angiostrongylus costaricensis]|uniref:Uncharacterized protein n=1 Tax=Angiostrongylus costaricensis TaxID=334426 RepID=A0A158PMD3_ANGCS|nr:unnamed protein product [Angiostrongylus costaricensis]